MKLIRKCGLDSNKAGQRRYVYEFGKVSQKAVYGRSDSA